MNKQRKPRRRFTPEERAARQKEESRIFWGNIAYIQKDLQKWTRAQKRMWVIKLTRIGLTSTEIHNAVGVSVAFVNDTLRDFAHLCTVELLGDAMTQFETILAKVKERDEQTQ